MNRITGTIAKILERRLPVEGNKREKIRLLAVGLTLGAATVTVVALIVLSSGAVHAPALVSIMQGVKHGAEITALAGLLLYIGTHLTTRDTTEAENKLARLQKRYIAVSQDDAEFESRMNVLLGYRKNELYIVQKSIELAQEMSAQKTEASITKAIEFLEKQKQRLAAQFEKTQGPLRQEIERRRERIATLQREKQTASSRSLLQKNRASIEQLRKKLTAKKSERAMLITSLQTAIQDLEFDRIEAKIKAGDNVDLLRQRLDRLPKEDQRWNVLGDRLDIIKVCQFLDSAKEIADDEWEQIIGLADDRKQGPLRERLLKSIAYAALRLDVKEEYMRSAVEISSSSELKEAFKETFALFDMCHFLETTTQISDEKWEEIDSLLEREFDPLRDKLLKHIAYASMRLGLEQEFIENAIEFIHDEGIKERVSTDYHHVKEVRARVKPLTVRLANARAITDPVVRRKLHAAVQHNALSALERVIDVDARAEALGAIFTSTAAG